MLTDGITNNINSTQQTSTGSNINTSTTVAMEGAQAPSHQEMERFSPLEVEEAIPVVSQYPQSGSGGRSAVWCGLPCSCCYVQDKKFVFFRYRRNGNTTTRAIGGRYGLRAHHGLDPPGTTGSANININTGIDGDSQWCAMCCAGDSYLFKPFQVTAFFLSCGQCGRGNSTPCTCYIALPCCCGWIPSFCFEHKLELHENQSDKYPVRLDRKTRKYRDKEYGDEEMLLNHRRKREEKYLSEELELAEMSKPQKIKYFQEQANKEAAEWNEVAGKEYDIGRVRAEKYERQRAMRKW